MGDIGGGLEARRAEAVDGRGTSGVRETSGEGRSADLVGGLSVRDLR